MLKVVYEEKVPVAVVVYEGKDICENTIKDLKAHGITVVYRQITVTPDNAIKAEKAGDIIVATGMDEGGTLPGHNIGTFSIVPLIVDSVKIPVMAEGVSLGAEGLFWGTLFLSAIEEKTV